MTEQTEALDEPATAVRQRTRRAILEAAVTVWAREFAASLGDIAEQAEVSRSTLHRYFPDRQGLLDAALTDALTRIERACVDATARCTTAAEELEALMRASIRMGDAVIFLFADPARFAGHPDWSDDEEDHELADLVERAQSEGALAADLDGDWVIGAYYALVYTAAEMINRGALAPHVAADLAVRTFFRGVSEA